MSAYIPSPAEDGRFPEDIHRDAELQIGKVDGPDVLEEPDETEPESAEFHANTRFRTPVAGERISSGELQTDLDNE
jgi:hypothetical protein